MKTLNDWVKKYEAKAEKLDILPGFSLDYVPGKGFMCWKVIGRVFEIGHTCTNDVKFFENRAIEAAKEMGCVKIRTQTFRDPVAYRRLTGAIIRWDLSGVRPNGKMYWVFDKEVR